MKRFSFSAFTILFSIAIGTTACVTTPEFPTSGTPSPYDGKWSGELSSKISTCAGISTDFEVRYGQLIGAIRKDGVKQADIWGQINGNGKLDGNIGKLGISGGGADITFSANTASGTWYGSRCNGQASFSKI